MWINKRIRIINIYNQNQEVKSQLRNKWAKFQIKKIYLLLILKKIMIKN